MEGRNTPLHVGKIGQWLSAILNLSNNYALTGGRVCQKLIGPAREPLGQLSLFHGAFKFRGRLNSVAFRKCFQLNRAARLAWPREHLRSLNEDEHGGIDPSGKHVVR